MKKNIFNKITKLNIKKDIDNKLNINNTLDISNLNKTKNEIKKEILKENFNNKEKISSLYKSFKKTMLPLTALGLVSLVSFSGDLNNLPKLNLIGKDINTSFVLQNNLNNYSYKNKIISLQDEKKSLQTNENIFFRKYK